MKKFLVLGVLLLMCMFAYAEDIYISGNPPLGVTIDSTTFDMSTRELNVKTVIQNTTEKFYNNINYEIALFHGDALAEEGFLFEPLEYVISGKGKIAELNPKGISVLDLNYTPPETIENGKYFLILYILDEEGTPLGDDYANNAVFMTGRGGFVPALRGYFKTSNGYDSLLFGWFIEKEEKPQIIIPLEENLKFKERILKENIIAEINVYSVSFEKQLVHSYGKKGLTISEDSEKGQSVIYELLPGEWTKAGPYEVEMKLFDSQGKEISKSIIARWLVKGFFSRIDEKRSSTNYYTSLAPVDLEVEVVSWVPTGSKKIKVMATIVGEENEYTLEKEIDVSSQENSVVKFTELIPSELKVKNILVSIESEEEELLDQKTFEITNESKIVSGEFFTSIKDTSPDENKPFVESPENGEIPIILIALIVIIIIVVGFVLMKKKGDSK